MNDEQKRIAYKAIDANVEDTTARQIIRYVMECELWGQDSISPSIDYLAKKYTWTYDTTKVAISKAKKSQFVTTTGYGKHRCFELNVGFLKGEMAKIFQKNLRPMADFSDVLPNTLPKGLPNSSPNTLPNTFLLENGLTEPQEGQNEGDNSNSNNYNLPAELRSDIVIVKDEEEKPQKTDKRVKEKESVFLLFGGRQAWWLSASQRTAALALLDNYGYDQVAKAVALVKESQDDPFAPKATTPSQLVQKWGALLNYKNKKL